jgi:hypothetical protein
VMICLITHRVAYGYRPLNDRMPLLSVFSKGVSFLFSLFAVREAKYYEWSKDCEKKLAKTLLVVRDRSATQ